MVTHCLNSYITLDAKQHTSFSSGKQTLTIKSEEAMLSSSEKHKPTIETGNLPVTEEWGSCVTKAERCPQDVADLDQACS